jgi:hypothetical protein
VVCVSMGSVDFFSFTRVQYLREETQEVRSALSPPAAARGLRAGGEGSPRLLRSRELTHVFRVRSGAPRVPAPHRTRGVSVRSRSRLSSHGHAKGRAATHCRTHDDTLSRPLSLSSLHAAPGRQEHLDTRPPCRPRAPTAQIHGPCHGLDSRLSLNADPTSDTDAGGTNTPVR